MNWLLEESVHAALVTARANVEFTAAQRSEFTAAVSSGAECLVVAGDTAEIHVKGVLTPTPDIFAHYFGGGNTTYPDIIAAIAAAESNPEVTETVYRFDTGGGSINGMFDAIAAMQAAKKPSRGIVGSMAASAGYALASQAGKLTAASKASMLGSIGIAVDTYVSDHAVSVTSTHAPKKRHDLKTPEGKAALVEELDAVHELFAEAIAEGRGTTVDKVNSDFGRGGVLLADAALKNGMIDAVALSGLQSEDKPKLKPKHKASNMETLAELQAQHPDIYAQAVAVGTAGERDRVTAHTTMGEASGDMPTALAAVADGSGMTATLQAKYMAAGMNRNSQADRVDDDGAAAAALAAAAAAAADPQAAKDKQVTALFGQVGDALGMQLGMQLGDK